MHSLFVCVCGGVCGEMAAERFINPVHRGSVGFTLRHQRLKDVSTTQARQCLSKILISPVIFYHSNPPPPTLQTRHLYKSSVSTVRAGVCFHFMHKNKKNNFMPIRITGFSQRFCRFKDPIFFLLCSQVHIVQSQQYGGNAIN